MERLQPRRIDGRFVNPAAPPDSEGSFRDLLKWRRERKQQRRIERPPEVPRATRDGPVGAPPREGIVATWVGHSSVVLQLDGATYLTDPVWSERIGHGAMKRLTPPGIAWTDLPRIDGVLLSHNHYDHMDTPTLKRLPRDTPIVCPTGVGAWLRKRGFTRVHERSWWESADVGAHRVTVVPAQHFSARTPWDRNRTLWGGLVVEGDRGASAYYAGDSGYFPGFRQIGEAFPDLDLVIMPVGAYEPRWFMSVVHVDPPEAGQAFLDTGGHTMLPVHWGTFRLADEPIDEPPRALARWWAAQGLASERLAVPSLGETVRVAHSKADLRTRATE